MQIVSTGDKAVLTSTHNLCFEQKYEQLSGFFLSDFFFFFLGGGGVGGGESEIFHIFE